jgi:hypothetical protein
MAGIKSGAQVSFTFRKKSMMSLKFHITLRLLHIEIVDTGSESATEYVIVSKSCISVSFLD